MKAISRLLMLAACFVLAHHFAFAQGAATGDLHITVKDPKGSAVTDATVTVRDVGKGVERTGTGDGQGGYSVTLLSPGSYSVRVDAAGFSAAQADDVVITVGERAELPIALTIASGKEVITVNA